MVFISNNEKLIYLSTKASINNKKTELIALTINLEKDKAE